MWRCPLPMCGTSFFIESLLPASRSCVAIWLQSLTRPHPYTTQPPKALALHMYPTTSPPPNTHNGSPPPPDDSTLSISRLSHGCWYPPPTKASASESVLSFSPFFLPLLIYGAFVPRPAETDAHRQTIFFFVCSRSPCFSTSLIN